MIVYKATKPQFLDDVYYHNIEDIISDKVRDNLNMKVGKSEYGSWTNSLPQVEQLLRDPSIPADAGVAIEYNIPQTRNRVDFIICGQDEDQNDRVVLIELKQWSKATLTAKDGMVNTRFQHGYTDTQHPSYQAWSYSMLLNSFNVAVYEGRSIFHHVRISTIIKMMESSQIRSIRRISTELLYSARKTKEIFESLLKSTSSMVIRMISSSLLKTEKLDHQRHWPIAWCRC